MDRSTGRIFLPVRVLSYITKTMSCHHSPGTLKESVELAITAENEYTRQLDETTQNAFASGFCHPGTFNDQRDYQG